MEAHANVRDMGLIEAKLAYIKGWQALPEFGVSYFVIKMANGKKEVRKSELQNSHRGTFEIKIEGAQSFNGRVLESRPRTVDSSLTGVTVLCP